MINTLIRFFSGGLASLILTCVAACFFFWADWKIGVGFLLCCLASGVDREAMASYKELIKALTGTDDKGGPQ